MNDINNSFANYYVLNDGFLALIISNKLERTTIWGHFPINTKHKDFSYIKRYLTQSKGRLYTENDFRLLQINCYNSSPLLSTEIFCDNKLYKANRILIEPALHLDDFFIEEQDQNRIAIFYSTDFQIKIPFSKIELFEKPESSLENERLNFDIRIVPK